MPLCAAGSNPHAQLGVGHAEDAHVLARCVCVDGGEQQPFPPPGWRVCEVANNASTTLALCVRTDGGQEASVWAAGRWPSEDADASPAFHRVQPSEFAPVLGDAAEHWAVAHVAATFDTMFLALRLPGADDVVLSAGHGNAFGQLGMGPYAPQHTRIHRVQLGAVKGDGEKDAVLRVDALAGGVRHAAAVVRVVRAETLQTLVVGWGQARAGQLGHPLPAPVRGPSGQPCCAHWAPVAVWRSESRGEHRVQLSLGRSHTAIGVQTPGGQEAHLVVLGRDVLHRSVSGLVPSQAQAHKTALPLPPGRLLLGSTWNTLLGAVARPGGLQIVGGGSEAYGIVAGAQAVAARVGRDPVQLACGSAHALALVRGAVWGWGWNEHGNLSQGTTEDATEPVQLALDGAQASAVWGGCGSTFVSTEELECGAST